ncbi:MAG: 30S ribosomal protein S16 [Patescibacteria group bacterium]|nr:30S ribosomal protein S16 [Patescibacteria group bacterium]MDE2015646.1 30S ribosomal protein S16 [Patescibacteria group bacterium]MDE2226703.1 30S ribosomal protein S16 [Patescibacteria group bacterium]
MLSIRLQRIGKKHQPGYRVVVAEDRSKLGGPPVEDLGSYNPQSKTATVKKDRLDYWLGIGAKASVTTHNLFVKNGLISGPKVAVKMNKPKQTEAEAAAASAAPVTATPQPEPTAVAEPQAEKKAEESPKSEGQS